MTKRVLALTSLLAMFATTAFAEPAKSGSKALYEKNCKLCHAVDGKGNPKLTAMDLVGLNLTDKETSDKKDDKLKETISKGAGKMKGFKDKISEDDITALVAYIRSLK